MYYKLKITLSWDHTGCFFLIHPDITRHTRWMQFSLLPDCHHSEIEIRILILHFHW